MANLGIVKSGHAHVQIPYPLHHPPLRVVSVHFFEISSIRPVQGSLR